MLSKMTVNMKKYHRYLWPKSVLSFKPQIPRPKPKITNYIQKTAKRKMNQVRIFMGNRYC